MRNNETGEFELVVGNGQLLSGFFIVILLCAVMFALGFVVARAKYQQDAANGGASTSAGSLRPQPGGSVQPSTPVPSEAPPPTAAAVPPDQPPQPQPQTDAGAPPDSASKPPEAAPVAAEGKYWQVSATANEDSARALLRTLKDAGFPASLSPGPNNLTRVLVGPYTDTGSMGRAKTELESAGFQPVKH